MGHFSAHLNEGQWLLSSAFNDGMPTRLESFIWHKPKGNLQLGIGLLERPKTIRWMANYELRHQKRSIPSLTVGVGLQELGTGNPGVFATANWALTPFLKAPSSLYLGVGRRITTKGNSLDKWRPLFGASAQIVKGVSATVQMDGKNWHGILSAKVGDVRIGLFAYKFKTMGIIAGWRTQ